MPASTGATSANAKDWVEHCTALVEDRAGNLRLLHWPDHGTVQHAQTGTPAVNTLDLDSLLAKR